MYDVFWDEEKKELEGNFTGKRHGDFTISFIVLEGYNISGLECDKRKRFHTAAIL